MYYILANSINASIPFFLLPILTSHLGSDDYGRVAMFQILLGGFSVLIGFNVSSAATIRVFQSNKDSEIRDYISVCLQLVVIFGVVVFLAAIFLRDILLNYIGVDTHALFLAILIGIMLPMIQIRLAQWQARQSVFKYCIFQISNTFLNMILSIIFVVYFLGSAEGRIYAIFITCTTFFSLSIFLLYRDGLLVFKIWNQHLIKDILKFCFPLLPHSFGIFVLASADRSIINNMMGSSSVGIYAVALQLSLVLNIFFESFNNAYSPWLLSRLASKDKEKHQEIVKVTYFLSVIIVLLVMSSVIVTPTIITLFLSKEYIESTNIVGILLIGQGFLGMQLLIVNYLYYTKKTILISCGSLVSGVIHVFLLFKLIPDFGIFGASLAFSLSMFIRFVIFFVFSQHSYPMPWLHFSIRR